MTGCTYILEDGMRIDLAHFPQRKKPVIVLREPGGRTSGHAVLHDEESLEAFERMFDRLLKPREERR